MSAVSLLCSLRERPSDENQKDGSNQEGHEENGVAAGNGGGGGDPAVLAVGPARRPLTYTREELMRLRNSPLVKRNLENAFAGCEALALVLKRRSDSPNEDDRGAKGDAPNENHKGVFGRERDRERRSADPRERVRKESEPSGGGIVLSPQRRSFTSGCGAPSAAPPAPPHVARTRPESPLPIAAAQPALAAKTEQGGRRIGSGRILVRDVSGTWDEGDYRAEHRTEHRADVYRPPRDRDHRANGDRFERRSFGRDAFSSDMKRERDDRFTSDKTRDRDDNRRSGGRYNRRYDKDEEPEWFSGGPTSQLETIELRGFDDPPKKNGTTNNKDNDKWNSSGTRSPLERWRETSSPVQPPAETADTSNDKDSGVDSKTEEPQMNNEQPEFNLDEFLKFDSIPDVLTNGSGENEGGSRFSRWFRRESPTNDARHYERLLHNMVDELDNSTRLEATPPAPASEPQHVFAPISPAGGPRAQPTLLELLLRANEPRPDSGAAVGGKMHSLEELEARLRPQPQHHHHDHDLTAFKRLLAQVSGGHAVAAAGEAARAPPAPAAPHHHPHHHPQPMSLLQMLNKSVEQQQKAQQQQQQQQQKQPPHIPQELLYKLLQVQQRQQQAGDVPGHVGGVMPPAPDRELLQRPEAQAIVQGLKAGEITVQHLMQQLGNPGLQSRHREVLLTILRLHQQQRQMGGSPLPPGVGGAGHLVVPHHQPLRLSPLPHQAYCVSPIMASSPNSLSVHHSGVPTRIPSPRELAAHTQSIMQNALIKKKLEEQRENYRRRHEMQHAPHQHQHQPKQPTPISFTPTSVLRKMTAEKESDTPSPKQQQQWAQPTKLPQGRAIVKGNQSGAAPPMGYGGPTPAEYQQHYLNQQQMVGGVRSFPHSQQRQPVNNSFNNMNNMARGMAGGSALHQLLVQSHQRSLNEMSGGAGGAGAGGAAGGDNQLARWFSPELLARAHAGKLPSVHVPNALSLEDLERHHHDHDHLAHHAPPVRN